MSILGQTWPLPWACPALLAQEGILGEWAVADEGPGLLAMRHLLTALLLLGSSQPLLHPDIVSPGMTARTAAP